MLRRRRTAERVAADAAPTDPRDVVYLRRATFDAGIWASVVDDYPTLPESFAPGAAVLDVGCHTGAFAALAADRGARVVAYEACHANYVLACLNLAGRPAVTVRHAAVWRSDGPAPTLRLTPNVEAGNTGGGSVLFASTADHWAARPERIDPASDEPDAASEPVAAVALDDVLAELGPVRFLKLDAEGAEFPILLTSRRLDLVAEIAGEYHELTGEARARLAEEARLPGRDWTAALLADALRERGFAVGVRPTSGRRGLFVARR